MPPKFVQKDYSVRFVEVFEELIETKSVASMTDFCQRLTLAKSNMSAIRSGNRDVTTESIIKVWQHFGGNPVYVLLGHGEKVTDRSHAPTLPNKSVSLDTSVESKLVSRLEELVATKTEFIEHLKKEVERLNIELSKKSK